MNDEYYFIARDVVYSPTFRAKVLCMVTDFYSKFHCTYFKKMENLKRAKDRSKELHV